MPFDRRHSIILTLSTYEQPVRDWQLAPDSFDGIVTYKKIAAAFEPFAATHLSIYRAGDPKLEDTSASCKELEQKESPSGLSLSSSFQPIGNPVYTRSGDPSITGLVATLTECTEPAKEDYFNQWYDELLTPLTISSGLFHTGLRYRSLGHQESKQYLALYLTDTDDLATTWHTLTTNHRPRWQAEGKYIDIVHVTLLAIFEGTRHFTNF